MHHVRVYFEMGSYVADAIIVLHENMRCLAWLCFELYDLQSYISAVGGEILSRGKQAGNVEVLELHQ